jgi:hypothetical protein
MAVRFALVVKVDFLVQNSLVLQHRQLRKLLTDNAFGWRGCCNWT